MAIGRQSSTVTLVVLVLAVIFLANDSSMIQTNWLVSSESSSVASIATNSSTTASLWTKDMLGPLREFAGFEKETSAATSASNETAFAEASLTTTSRAMLNSTHRENSQEPTTLRGTIDPKMEETNVSISDGANTTMSGQENVNHTEETNESSANETTLGGGATMTAPMQTNLNVSHQDELLHAQEKPSDFFSACMLTMDDNHFLTEWLAYHYLTLPLRHFIVAVDPNSKTSPSELFDRWRAHGMLIEEWSDENFIPADWLAWTRKPNQTEQEKVDVYITRQNSFMTKCLLELKAKNRTWTLLADSDEYLVLNQHKSDASTIRSMPSIDQPSSTMSFLRQHTNSSSSPCVMLPRLRFGTRESSPKKRHNRDTHFNASTFQTLRFRKHANRADLSMNKISKAMVDVSRISEEVMVVENLHRPIKAVCPKEHLYIKVADSFYVLHHYLGTWEQFNFRNDVRKGEGRARNPKVRLFSAVACFC